MPPEVKLQSEVAGVYRHPGREVKRELWTNPERGNGTENPPPNLEPSNRNRSSLLTTSVVMRRPTLPITTLSGVFQPPGDRRKRYSLSDLLFQAG